jgi:hypothetical protein
MGIGRFLAISVDAMLLLSVGLFDLLALAARERRRPSR